MSLSVVLALVLLGTILIILEILLIPGTTVAGIIGSVLAFGGIVAAFHYHGAMMGIVALALSLLAVAISWWILLKTGGSKWMSLSETLEGKSQQDKQTLVSVGDTGITISRLNPVGKAEINGNLVEVSGFEGFIDESVEIRVIEVSPNSIIVTINKS